MVYAKRKTVGTFRMMKAITSKAAVNKNYRRNKRNNVKAFKLNVTNIMHLNCFLTYTVYHMQ